MLKAFRQAPFLRLVLFFILGILVQYQWDISSYFLVIFAFSFLLIIFSLLPTVTSSYNSRWVFGVGILSLIFVFAAYLTREAWNDSDWKIPPQNHDYEVRILEEPVRKPKTWMCKVKILSADTLVYDQVIDKKVIVYLPADSLSSSLVVGNAITLNARLDKPTWMPADQSFDYPTYLRKQGYSAVGFVSRNHWKLREKPVPIQDILKFFALKCRRTLLVHLHTLIPDEKNYSIAAALVFGYKNELDKDLRASFADTGVSHVLAVSGLHFATIYAIFYFLLSFLGASRRSKIIRQLILLPLMVGYAFMTGLPPSVTRALIMLSIWGIGSAFFHRSFTLNTVAVAAFFMLLYNPFYLFDVGFQLSFSAVIAIVVFNPFFNGLYTTFNPVIKYFWDLCCVSTSAQLGVAPLILYYFHQFPVIYLVSNLFAIPLVGILLVLIPFSLFLQFIFGPASWVLYPVNSLLHFFISGVVWLQSIPFGVITNIHITVFEAFYFFLLIISIVLVMVKKRIVYFYIFGLLVVFGIFYLLPL